MSVPGPITPWVSQLNPVVNGEAVAASVTNRPTNQLGQRTQYLKDILDSIEAGAALFDREAAVSTSVTEGMAVYWDATALEYKPAIAAVTFDTSLGVYVASASSFVEGICAFKYTANSADILLNGIVKNFDFINGAGVHGTVPANAGPYYLSAVV